MHSNVSRKGNATGEDSLRAQVGVYDPGAQVVVAPVLIILDHGVHYEAILNGNHGRVNPILIAELTQIISVLYDKAAA